MPVLAVPENSQLLIIDPWHANACRLGSDLKRQLAVQFKRISSAADLALVPRYFAVSQGKSSGEMWLSTPCEKNKPRVFGFEHDRPVWSNKDLLNAMRKEGRDQLFICGFWLDDVVTAAALEAQPIGFNTHVIVDLSPSLNVEKRQLSIDRLNQYCIVPMPLQNLLYEWTAKTDDHIRRKALEAIWTEQQQAGGSREII
ncbi:isochorismatase family protein [Nitratireductor sp. XY-223]|uniref:isochorismatase family protein n=1 Tax=Nitratireductor sp. XY-223 TaxID=2561926 RepID=UPI0010AA505D|nr:isochorismatase family protein [Nitratireductor sp. XY-223]